MTDRVTNVPLPEGHTLTVRPATTGDIDGLMALYDSLSNEDRHLRFFTLTRPRRQVMEHFIEANYKHGLWLVAVTDGGEIVADGGYTRLPDGDAEFALTVRKDWRGWLGPFLLDLLLHDAGEHDIDNLRAIVLRENRPMMRLIERHGYACIDQPDWARRHRSVACRLGRHHVPRARRPFGGRMPAARGRPLPPCRRCRRRGRRRSPERSPPRRAHGRPSGCGYGRPGHRRGRGRPRGRVDSSPRGGGASDRSGRSHRFECDAGGVAAAEHQHHDGRSARRPAAHWTTRAVTMPNMPFSFSACGRMWQCQTHVPGSVAWMRTVYRSPGATVTVSSEDGLASG